MVDGYPKMITDEWPGVPSPIDASVAYEGKYSSQKLKGQRSYANQHFCGLAQHIYPPPFMLGVSVQVLSRCQKSTWKSCRPLIGRRELTPSP